MTDERSVLVTGGARGIRRTIAAHLAEKGWKVIATFRTGHDEAMELGRTHGVEVRQLDMTERDATLGFARQIRSEFAVEALVNNAGILEKATQQAKPRYCLSPEASPASWGPAVFESMP